MNKSSSGMVASKQPLMSGSLCAIDFSQQLLNVQALFDSVVKPFIKKLKQEIEQDLRNDEDWERFIPYLSVTVEGTDLVIEVNHPDSFDLEYGGPDTPMKSKLRSYAYEAGLDLSSAIEKAFKKEFG